MYFFFIFKLKKRYYFGITVNYLTGSYKGYGFFYFLYIILFKKIN